MSIYTTAYHQIIAEALKSFNKDYLYTNNIIFGGGTLIALSIDEYRESVDIDFFCPNTTSYRAVRSQVTNVSLGNLVFREFNYVRDIRADRDAVRTIVNINNVNVKIEFVSFSDYQLKRHKPNQQFPVPYLDKVACFSTKLLANADRYNTAPYKDIFDLIAMYLHWGEIPKASWEEAKRHYGEYTIMQGLAKALQQIIQNKNSYFQHAQSVKMKVEWQDRIINIGAEQMHKQYFP